MTLTEIPFVDISGGTPVDLVRLFPQKAHDLAAAAKNTLGVASRAVAFAGLPLMDRASRNWLERNASPYREEIAQLADVLGIRGVWFLNICFEWGCTTGVWETPGGPVLRRVLDWPFPRLGENLVIAAQRGEAGDFFNITWPGFNGVLQAMSPGRFSAAINQAPGRRHGAGYVGDWLKNRIAVDRAGDIPPAHLLRQVFETAPDYQTAKRALCVEPIAVPAIITLSGTKPGEGCVIERTETAFAVREIECGRVCAANHFEAHPDDTKAGWRARPIDSAGRASCARELTGEESDFDWFVAPIANDHSRLVFNANAASSDLQVMGVFGAEPVTSVFTLGAAA